MRSQIKPNGPAIWGGCVTRRKHRHKSVPVGHKTVTPCPGEAERSRGCKEGMACVFTVMVQVLLRAGAITAQVGSEPRIYPRLQIWLRALAQYRAEGPDRPQGASWGTNCLGARNLSRCRILTAFRCALCPPKRSEGGCPGATEPLQICLEGRSKSKKCDKQLTHIVRVRFSYLFINESTSDFNFGR